MVYALIRIRGNEKEAGELAAIGKYCKNRFATYKTIKDIIDNKAQVNQLNKALLKQLRAKDVLIIPGYSVIGRTVKIVTDFLIQLLKKEISVHSISDSSSIGGQHRNVKDQIKILSTLGGIETSIMQDRTRRSRISKKISGKKMGRPKGSSSSHLKLSGQEDKIKSLLKMNMSYTTIGKMTGTTRVTVKNFIILKNLE